MILSLVLVVESHIRDVLSTLWCVVRLLRDLQATQSNQILSKNWAKSGWKGIKICINRCVPERRKSPTVQIKKRCKISAKWALALKKLDLRRQICRKAVQCFKLEQNWLSKGLETLLKTDMTIWSFNLAPKITKLRNSPAIKILGGYLHQHFCVRTQLSGPRSPPNFRIFEYPQVLANFVHFWPPFFDLKFFRNNM